MILCGIGFLIGLVCGTGLSLVLTDAARHALTQDQWEKRAAVERLLEETRYGTGGAFVT